jgi:uroporphyrinogen decarboxylase
MSVMNHRERALLALNHKEPDRVPIDLSSNRNTGILIEPYQALVEYLSIDEKMTLDDFGQSKVARVASPSEEVLQRLDIDFRGIFLDLPDRPLEKILPDGSHQDELGVIRQRPSGSYYYDIVSSPLDGEISVNDIQNWNWPDFTDPGYVRNLRKEALHYRNTIDCALVLHLQDIIVHPSQYMRGFEQWYTDFILEPNLISVLLDKLLEIRSGLTIRALEEVGDLIDVVSCSDDVADQRGPQISPKMYREFIKPRHQIYFDTIRRYTSAKILYHSCGAITKLLPDFIDLGVDFINPVQVSANDMDTASLKKNYGKDIGFWGAIDTMRVLPYGSPDDVRSEVRHRIRDLAPGGGYVLAAVHNIQPNVPPENIVAMFEAAWKLGIYPIEVYG